MSLYYPSLLEAQTDIVDGTAIVAAGEGEANGALRAVLYRAGVDFPIGEVDMPVARQERTVFDRQSEIGVLTNNMYLFASLQPSDELLVTFR